METCQNATIRKMECANMDLLVYMEYAFEHIGFIPKWIGIRAY
jgi:hypothetical protein